MENQYSVTIVDREEGDLSERSADSLPSAISRALASFADCVPGGDAGVYEVLAEAMIDVYGSGFVEAPLEEAEELQELLAVAHRYVEVRAARVNAYLRTLDEKMEAKNQR